MPLASEQERDPLEELRARLRERIGQSPDDQQQPEDDLRARIRERLGVAAPSAVQEPEAEPQADQAAPDLDSLRAGLRKRLSGSQAEPSPPPPVEAPAGPEIEPQEQGPEGRPPAGLGGVLTRFRRTMGDPNRPPVFTALEDAFIDSVAEDPAFGGSRAAQETSEDISEIAEIGNMLSRFVAGQMTAAGNFLLAPFSEEGRRRLVEDPQRWKEENIRHLQEDVVPAIVRAGQSLLNAGPSPEEAPDTRAVSQSVGLGPVNPARVQAAARDREQERLRETGGELRQGPAILSLEDALRDLAAAIPTSLRRVGELARENPVDTIDLLLLGQAGVRGIGRLMRGGDVPPGAVRQAEQEMAARAAAARQRLAPKALPEGKVTKALPEGPVPGPLTEVPEGGFPVPGSDDVLPLTGNALEGPIPDLPSIGTGPRRGQLGLSEAQAPTPAQTFPQPLNVPQIRRAISEGKIDETVRGSIAGRLKGKGVEPEIVDEMMETAEQMESLDTGLLDIATSAGRPEEARRAFLEADEGSFVLPSDGWGGELQGFAESLPGNQPMPLKVHRIRSKFVARGEPGSRAALSLDEFAEQFGLSEGELLHEMSNASRSDKRLRMSETVSEFLDIRRGEAEEILEVMDPENMDEFYRTLTTARGQKFQDAVEIFRERTNLRMLEEELETFGFGADEAEEAVENVSAAVSASKREPTVQAPAFYLVTGKELDSVAARVSDSVPPPEAAIPLSRQRKWWRTRVQNKFDSQGVDEEVQRRILYALTGKNKLPRDKEELKRVSMYLDDVKAGQQKIPATRKEIRQMRRDLGEDFVDGPPDDGKMPPGPPAGKDPLEAVTEPAPTAVQNKSDIGVSKYVRDTDKVVPEIAQEVRPLLHAYHDDRAEFALQWNQLVDELGGPKRLRAEGPDGGLSIDGQVAAILNGDFGPSRQVLSGEIRVPEVHPDAVRLAKFARDAYDVRYEQLRQLADLADLPYNPDYITWLRDDRLARQIQTPDMIRMFGRKMTFRFQRRSGAPAPDEISFIDSFRVYHEAAFRKIHFDPILEEIEAGARLYEEAGQPNRARVALALRDYMRGDAFTSEKFIDTTLQRLPGFSDLVESDRLALRSSIGLTSAFYRGVLGLNFSAAVNNLTQTVNTMAAAGIWPTMKGVFRFGADELAVRVFKRRGRTLAQEVNLNRDFVELFGERIGLKMGGFGRITMDDVLFAPFSLAEYVNRGIAFHTGVGAGLRRGLTMQEAISEGVRLAGMTQFFYDELGRALTFRDPIGRVFGVLASFPVKQLEFLGELAKTGGVKGAGPVADIGSKPGLALLRYFAVTGMASVMVEKGTGFLTEQLTGESVPAQVGALRSVGGVPGTEPLSQLVGIEGTVFTTTPPVQALKDSFATLVNVAEGDPEGARRAFAAMLEGAASAVPAGVAMQEFSRAWANAATGEIRRPTGVIPGVKEFRERGDLIMATTPGREVAKLLGFTPLEERRMREENREYTKLKNSYQGERSRALDRAAAAGREGEDLEASVSYLEGIDLRDSSVKRALESTNSLAIVRNMKSGPRRLAIEYLQDNPDVREMILKQIEMLERINSVTGEED